NVGAAFRIIAREHFRAAEIFAVLVRIGHDFRDGGRIANAEIESLRADRRHHMRGFADKHYAVATKTLGGLPRKRKYATSSFDGDGSEQRVSAALDFSGQSQIVHGRKLFAVVRRDHADQARTVAGERDQREWTFLGMKFSRRIVVRPRMRKIER